MYQELWYELESFLNLCMPSYIKRLDIESPNQKSILMYFNKKNIYTPTEARNFQSDNEASTSRGYCKCRTIS